jgi:hypothetical protein
MQSQKKSHKSSKKNFRKPEAKFIFAKKDSDIYFNGGSSVDWFKAKKKLESALREGEVWELVEIPENMTPDLNDELPEVLFDKDEPSYHDIVEEKINAWNEALDQRLQIEVEEINETFRDKKDNLKVELYRIHAAIRAEKSKEVQMRADYEKLFMSMKKQYEDEKEKYDNKIAKCMMIFRKRISTVGLIPVETLLRAHKFRNVWYQLNKFYQATNSGREGRSSVMSMVANIVWNGQNLHEHIDQMSALFSQCEDIGYPLNEDLRYEYLTKSITKSAKCPKQYIEVINQYNNMPQEITYQQLVDALQTKYNSLAIAKQLKSSIESAHHNQTNSSSNSANSNQNQKKKKRSEEGEYDSQTQAAKAESSGKPRKVCSYCNKTGHTKDQCWLLKTCENCGVKGHIAQYCPELDDDDSEEVHATQQVNHKKKDNSRDKSNKKEKSQEVNPQNNFRNKYPSKG